MSLKDLASKYIASVDRVFFEMTIAETCISVDINHINKLIEYAKAYLDDAKYYRDKKKFEVSLTSVAYCEGLLDALKILGAVKFEWSEGKDAKSGK